MEPETLDPELTARLFRTAPIGLAVVTAPGTISWASPAYLEATGRGPQIVGTDFHEIPETDGTWSPAIRRAMDAALLSGTASSFQSVRARFRGEAAGVYFDLDIRPLPVRAGAARQALLMVREVSDRVRERERSALFYESFRSSTNVMQLTDARGIMIDVNPAYERVYGYTREECIGRKPNLVRSRYTPPEVYQRMWADLLDPDRGHWTGEILNRDRSGRERPVLLSITAIRNPEGVITHYLGVAVDLSEKRSWERRAAHSEKLASVGQLAAGVAHEINTPLANIMLVAESLRRRTQDPWVLARLGTMTEQIEAAARIVRGLLDFSRQEAPQAVQIDLVDVARRSIEFLRGKQSADVEIVEEYADGPLPVSGDPGQLMQVLTNLLNNAYDAMGGVGSIRVSVRRRGEKAELEIIDQGPGIPAEAMPRLFEPFFTTKPEGQGTGLGLAICHGIVQSHHGSIVARNVPGAGAGFLVVLPLSGGPAPGAFAPPTAEARKGRNA